jgi:PadR family transcriptional regulator PadR
MAHSIGDFEQLILFALVRLGSDAYGVTIRRESIRCNLRVNALARIYESLRLMASGMAITLDVASRR